MVTPFKFQPSLLWLELTNRCNANPPCVFCERQYIGELQDMDFNLYKRIVDSCPSATLVQPQGVGEPLLYPHIVEAVAYARKKKKWVQFYTNASLLNNDLASQLLEAGLSKIRFSVDECSKEPYEAMRLGLSWKKVLSNIDNFQRLKNKGGYPTLTVVRACITPENKQRIGKIRQFWKNRVDSVMAKPEVDIPPPTELRKQKWSSDKNYVKCGRPDKHLSVKSNGDLVLCCRDWFHVYVMSNLKEANILEEYNNDKFNSVRKAIGTGVNYPTICKHCNDPHRRHEK